MSHPLPIVEPSDLELDAARIQHVYDQLEDWTSGEAPAFPAAAILIGRGGQMLQPRRFGRQQPGEEQPIRDDSVFLLASITKPFTYMAALQLVEEGRLNLSDRVAAYLPDFAENGKEEVRVHHLFTHTSGLPDMLPNNRQLRAEHAPRSQFVEEAMRLPLDFPPGMNLQYQSMGTLVAAELVHQLSGNQIETQLLEHIFKPLGMDSSRLGSAGLDEERIVDVEVPEEIADENFHWNSEYWRAFGAPWGGMFSSPEDLAILCHCLLRDGRLRERTLLSPATIRLATRNRLDDYPDLAASVRRTRPWGLGWQLNPLGSPNAFCDLLGRDVFGHTGATGTMLWIDRANDLYCILLSTAIRAKAPWRLVRLSNMVAASVW